MTCNVKFFSIVQQYHKVTIDLTQHVLLLTVCKKIQKEQNTLWGFDCLWKPFNLSTIHKIEDKGHTVLSHGYIRTDFCFKLHIKCIVLACMY